MCRVSGFVPKSGRRSGEKTVLTRKQNELLMFINKRLNDDGVSPSFDEMKEALRLKSKSGIHRLITGLEERGFLRRLPHRARALQVLKLPDAAAMPAPNVTPLLDPRRGWPKAAKASCRRSSAASGCRSPAPSRSPTRRRRSACRSTAGSPPARRSRRCATIPRPSTCRSPCSARARTTASRCRAIRWSRPASRTATSPSSRAPTPPRSGEIVVALIDDTEATLKRLRSKGASIALEPANAAYETRIFGPDRVKIQGRLAGLYRRYN